MLYAMGYEVERLRRTRIAGLTDYRMPPGACRRLTEKESAMLVAKPLSDKPRVNPVSHEQPKPPRKR